MWTINYRGFVVKGNNNQDECIVEFSTDKFSWETLHPTYRSAQVCITKFINAERQKEVLALHKQRGATK